MAQQNEILRQLLQRQPHPQQHGGGQHQRPPAAATYQEFLSTQPPLFTKAEDPLDADVWLRVVESKFPLLTGDCPDEAKARFAAQQLRGPARTWWDHFRAMLPADHEVSWEEFKTAFRGHHIPAGILDRKLNEFLALNTKLWERLNTVRADSFNELVNLAISQEDCIVAHRAEKKRKAPMAAPSAQA
ncbi:retrotransposon gag domain-containing protein [Escherichia coli]|nr:retrotransposon gag domain-containing protein [Escherichia coli]